MKCYIVGNIRQYLRIAIGGYYVKWCSLKRNGKYHKGGKCFRLQCVHWNRYSNWVFPVIFVCNTHSVKDFKISASNVNYSHTFGVYLSFSLSLSQSHLLRPHPSIQRNGFAFSSSCYIMCNYRKAISVSFMDILCKRNSNIIKISEGWHKYFFEILPIKMAFHLHRFRIRAEII